MRTRLGGLLAFCVPLAIAALAACTSTANIDDAWMSLDSDGSRHREIFYTDSTGIHCIAQGGFGRPDVTVEGTITQIQGISPTDGQTIIQNVDHVVADVDLHPTVTGGANDPPTLIDIELERVDATGQPSDTAPFPAGFFRCDVRVDGEVQKSVTFRIYYEECPVGQITPNSACSGFAFTGEQCPLGGQNTETGLCTCQTAGWQCPPK